jgi:hypothetical protein
MRLYNCFESTNAHQLIYYNDFEMSGLVRKHCVFQPIIPTWAEISLQIFLALEG